jgi:hypothetical protein
MLLAPLLEELLGLAAGELLWGLGWRERLAQNSFECIRVRQEPRLELLDGNSDDSLYGDTLDRTVEQALPLVITVCVNEDNSKVRLLDRARPKEERAQSVTAMENAPTCKLATGSAERLLEAHGVRSQSTSLLQAPAHKQVGGAEFLFGKQ